MMTLMVVGFRGSSFSQSKTQTKHKPLRNHHEPSTNTTQTHVLELGSQGHDQTSALDRLRPPSSSASLAHFHGLLHFPPRSTLPTPPVHQRLSR